MRFHFEVDTANAAFDGSLEDVRRELNRIFEQVMHDFLFGGYSPDGGPVRDINGNTVGRWSYTAAE
jgi:hypothetical protein